MATGTLGTNATTSLTSLIYRPDQSLVDIAAIANAIKNDNPGGLPLGQLTAIGAGAHPIFWGAFENNGLLYIPNRGVLQVEPGDYVGIDSQGWPILVSANSIANAAWTHT